MKKTLTHTVVSEGFRLGFRELILNPSKEIRLVYTQWQANVSVHSQNLGLTLQQYSMFWTINGLFPQP